MGHLGPTEKRGIEHVLPEASAEETPLLGNVIVKLSGPLVTAADQPPAPGSNRLIRGLWWGRRAGGWVLERLPSNTAAWAQILRLLTTVLAWMVMVVVAFYAVLIWAFMVMPVIWLIRRRRSVDVSDAALPPPPDTGTGAMSEGTGSRAQLAEPRQPDVAQQELLRRLPVPDPESATDRCPMCGGATAGSGPVCAYCGVGLPMIVSWGWHPDPLGSTDRCWFDGEGWTEFLRSDA